MGKRGANKNSESTVPLKKKNIEADNDNPGEVITPGVSWSVSMESIYSNQTPDFTGFKNKNDNSDKYERSDKGPYVVIIEKNNINPFIIGRELKKNKYMNIMNITLYNFL